MELDPDTRLCESCNQRPVLCVACVPGVPYSAGYCRDCLERGIHPWRILVANTAMMGGLEHAASWWREMCEVTWRYHEKTEEEFVAEVKKAMEEMEAAETAFSGADSCPS